MIYENMKFCEFWSYEKVLASHIFINELNMPCCTIEKEYALGAAGQLRTVSRRSSNLWRSRTFPGREVKMKVTDKPYRFHRQKA